MQKHSGDQHRSCLSEPTDHEKSPVSGWTIQNTAITTHSSQRRINGPTSITSWKFWGHSDSGPFECRRGRRLLCITVSQTTMTCSIIWMALCELEPRRRLNGRKTYSSPWNLRDRSCPNLMLKWLQRQLWFRCQPISSIISGSCNRLGGGTLEWISILRMRLSIISNTRGSFWSMWRMNTVPTIYVCLSVHLKAYQATRSSPLHSTQDPVKLLSIDMMCPVMTQHTERSKMLVKEHPDGAILQHTHRHPQRSGWIHLLNHHWTEGKWIRISLITTPIKWRLPEHFGQLIALSGVVNRRKHTQGSPISPMRHATYSLSHHMVSEWRPVFSLREVVLAGGSPEPQTIPFVKKS